MIVHFKWRSKDIYNRSKKFQSSSGATSFIENLIDKTCLPEGILYVKFEGSKT